jgi:hypothetical protein
VAELRALFAAEGAVEVLVDALEHERRMQEAVA